MITAASPYAMSGNRWLEMLDTHLDTTGAGALTLERFLSNRIRIKNLHSNIVNLKAKKVQLLHQQRKEEALAAGKKARYLLLKSIRMGMTTWEQALSYRVVTTMPNTTCVTLADTIPNTKSIFRMVNLMAKLDPQLKHKIMDSKVAIEIPAINTYFHIGTAGSRSFARGDNIYRAHGSEVSRWAGDYDTIDNLMAGVTEAARHGEVVLETTADGAQGWFYEKYKEAMEGGNQWLPLFYPWWLDPENIIIPTQLQEEEWLDTVTQEEREIMNEYDLSMPQMIWRADKSNELKKLFLQEYPETWVQAFLVRGQSFFDPEMIDGLMKNLNKPLTSSENLLIWERPKPNVEYCAGADTSEGNANSDMSVCGIIEKESGKQVAVLRGRWRPEVFARKCITLCKDYNNAVFACEINNHGHSVMNTVVNTLRYKSLFYRKKPLDKDKYSQQKTEHRPGWHTNASTRPLLLDDLNEALEQGYMQVNDALFLAECKTFVDNGGRYEADKGQHDDSIIAWGIAWQCRKQKKKSYII